LLADAKNDKDKITKTTAKNRLKEIKGDADYADEIDVLENYIKLSDEEADLAKKIKAALAELDKKVLARYKTLTIR
jgi:type I restriction enzyme M protein